MREVMACLLSQISSATDASRKRWNSLSGPDEAGKSNESPLTRSLEVEPSCATLRDHDGPVRSTSLRAEREALVFHAISPQRFSIFISRNATMRSDKSPFCGKAQAFVRSECASGAIRISSSPSSPSDKILGSAMHPAHPAALNSASGRFSGIQAHKIRFP